MRKIAFWSDYTWCDFDEVEQYQWMSDDYAIITVPIELSDDDIDTLLVDEYMLTSKYFKNK